MPVDLTPGRLDPDGASRFFSVAGDHCELVIGLVNFMPFPAMRRTEQEFWRLLQTDHAGCNVRLRRFAFYDPAEAGAVARYETMGYEPLDALWDARIDGLIVTGAEPKAASMADEPLLPLVRQLVDWCALRTRSAIFSCFAAHAAVWCLDGIARVRLPEKLSGLYDCHKCGDHPLLAAMPQTWRTPHSRHNTLDEGELRAAGYTILVRGPRLGADTFLRLHGDSQLVFWQGHPEYGPEVLLSEYCRDVRRFVSGVSARRPRWPEDYLDDARQKVTAALEQDPGLGSEAGALAKVIEIAAPRFDHEWAGAASRMAAGWLAALVQQAQPALEMKR